jgi:DNA-binding response OmpR family regulator
MADSNSNNSNITEHQTKILLVEDDTNLGFLLVDFLESNNFVVKLYRDGESGWRGFNIESFEFCILDVMLPKLDGFSLAQRIREKNKDVPILILTAKSMKEDKLYGFGLGIDDYMTKPFDEEEMLCHIKAILMRSKRGVSTDKDICYSIGSFTFDYPNQMLIHANLKRRLTVTETEVLKKLCFSKNQIVKRDDVLDSVWGTNDYFTGRSLDVFITKLRKYLLEDDNVKIESIPKVGFVLKDGLNR